MAMERQAVPSARLLAFLENPGSYPHGPDRVRVIQTHISYVAVAPPYAYKVKKPVDMGFLDFTTLAARRHYCEAEISLNRRLCADVYERVVPIMLRERSLTFGPGERVVEYALEMRSLEDGRFLDQRIAEADRDDVDRIVATLTTFYEGQARTADVARWGRVDALRVNSDENFAQTESAVGKIVSRAAHRAIRTFTDGFYDHHALLLNERRAGGHIVDGHGDLHLAHVHMTDDRVCIFDCIEFNERFRFIDVANDVAFMAMDMDMHGRPDLARHFVERLEVALADPGLSPLVNFYMCYRAVVRAKVEGMRSDQHEVPADERAASRERARRYFALALRYAVAGPDPLVIVLMGRVGTGKTTQAERLALALGWPAVSSDRCRKALAGVPLHGRSDDALRARLYTEDMTARTYEALRNGALQGAGRGQGVILDATYGERRRRDDLRVALEERDIGWFFVELSASDTTLHERLRERAGAPATVSDARLEDFATLNARYQAPDALEDPRHLVVATDDAGEDDTTARILESLVHLGWGREARSRR